MQYDNFINYINNYENTLIEREKFYIKTTVENLKNDIKFFELSILDNKKHRIKNQSIVAYNLAYSLYKKFDKVHSVKMRVGALPQNPSNKILYNLTWSTDGLINEYSNDCFAIKDSKLVKIFPLEGLENFSLDGLEYEAFNTSGGLGTLCDTLIDKVKELNYKTIRYKGHRHLMDFLINDLFLGKKKRRAILKEILEYAIPTTKQDVVLIFCTVTGIKNGKLEQITDVRKIYNKKLYGQNLSSIQITTATGLCTVLDLFVQGKINKNGFIKQEDIDLKDFLSNDFGKQYVI